MQLDDRMTIRIAKGSKKTFTKKCVKHKREATDVLREMIDAFNEGRLRITPPKDHKPLEIYDHEH